MIGEKLLWDYIEENRQRLVQDFGGIDQASSDDRIVFFMKSQDDEKSWVETSIDCRQDPADLFSVRSKLVYTRMSVDENLDFLDDGVSACPLADLVRIKPDEMTRCMDAVRDCNNDSQAVYGKHYADTLVSMRRKYPWLSNTKTRVEFETMTNYNLTRLRPPHWMFKLWTFNSVSIFPSPMNNCMRVLLKPVMSRDCTAVADVILDVLEFDVWAVEKEQKMIEDVARRFIMERKLEAL